MLCSNYIIILVLEITNVDVCLPGLCYSSYWSLTRLGPQRFPIFFDSPLVALSTEKKKKTQQVNYTLTPHFLNVICIYTDLQ